MLTLVRRNLNNMILLPLLQCRCVIRASYFSRSRLQVRTVGRLKEARRCIIATVSGSSLTKTAYNFTGTEEGEYPC